MRSLSNEAKEIVVPFNTTLAARIITMLGLLILTTSSFAGGSMSVAIDTCSGTREEPIADAYLIGCSGDLTLSNGEINSDIKVIISGASRSRLPTSRSMRQRLTSDRMGACRLAAAQS